MSHFTVVVFTKDREHPMQDVTRLMAPYDENEDREGSFWDWYVVGGRWDGAMTEAEPVIITEDCFVCKGTGTRPGALKQFGQAWVDQMKGCNGCLGTGKTERLPITEEEDGDVLGRNSCEPAQIKSDFVPFGFLTPDGEYISRGRMGWWGMSEDTDDEKAWAQKWTEAKGAFADTLAVLLDCHV